MDKFKKLAKRSFRRANLAGFAVLEAYQAALFKRHLNKARIPSFSFLVVTMVRNESLRLPYFFEYYKKLGVDRFLVLDHQSTDETAKVIAAEPTAVRVEIEGNFAFKRTWLQAAVSRLAQDRWCFVLDADEFIVWPGMENSSLRQLTEDLDAEGAEAFSCSLIDMYPGCSITQVGYQAGDDPLDYAPFFDRLGDTRERMFGVSPLLTKVPLMRLRHGHYLSKGQHNVRNAVRSKRSGALLHFKFLQDFKGKIRTNSMIKKFDPQYNTELEAYKEKLDEDETFILYNENSVRYENVCQLVKLGFAKA
jgi:glycosyltransferase involved in cell wall biosynthesis